MTIEKIWMWGDVQGWLCLDGGAARKGEGNSIIKYQSAALIDRGVQVFV